MAPPEAERIRSFEITRRYATRAGRKFAVVEDTALRDLPGVDRFVHVCTREHNVTAERYTTAREIKLAALALFRKREEAAERELDDPFAGL